jgi:hypothetical protein
MVAPRGRRLPLDAVPYPCKGETSAERLRAPDPRGQVFRGAHSPARPERGGARAADRERDASLRDPRDRYGGVRPTPARSIGNSPCSPGLCGASSGRAAAAWSSRPPGGRAAACTAAPRRSGPAVPTSAAAASRATPCRCLTAPLLIEFSGGARPPSGLMPREDDSDGEGVSR